MHNAKRASAGDAGPSQNLLADDCGGSKTLLPPTQRGRALVRRGTLAERKDDLYQTPECATRALLAAVPLPEVIWEPACGPGAIVRVLRQAGHKVYATDLIDYGCPDSKSRIDFLMEGAPSFQVDAIVTNPPFKLAEQFVQHALTLGIPKVIMLLRFAFLESERRCAILESGLLAGVYLFRKRLPMMHRHGWTGRKASSGIAFAWFSWDLAHRGPPGLHRISREGTP
jgi:hypothetical protein